MSEPGIEPLPAVTFLQALRSKSLRRCWPWILSTLPVLVLVHYLAVGPVGHEVVIWVEIFYALAALVVLPAMVILPLRALMWREERATSLAWWCAIFVFLASIVGGLVCGAMVRRWGFERLAERSAPLVQAIKAYEMAHGAPPPSLDALVPEYLPAVPGTGIMAYPHYRYFQDPYYANNPWVLYVDASRFGINFDCFLYFPLQNYPETGYGGHLERIGDWAYVHE